MTEKSLAVDAWESLFRAQVSVLRQLTAEFPTHEISFTEYDVLFNLSRAEGRCLRIRDLIPHLLLSQPSVSRLLDRLAARGLVEKTPDPRDARGTIVALTPAGFELFNASPIQCLFFDEVEEATFVAISKRGALRKSERALTKIRERLDFAAEFFDGTIDEISRHGHEVRGQGVDLGDQAFRKLPVE